MMTIRKKFPSVLALALSVTTLVELTDNDDNSLAVVGGIGE